MWPTSDAFAEALARPDRQWRSQVEILYAGELVQALDVVMSGSITIDDVAVRRAAKLTLIDPLGNLTPADARDILAPKGTEIRPSRGLVLADGSVEYVPLGVMEITEPKVTAERGGVKIDLTCKDRAETVRRRRFTEPWRVAAGTATHQAIADIVTSRFSVATRLTVTGYTTSEIVYDRLSDPWEAVQELAASDTLVAAFDPLGTLSVQRDEPVATGVTYALGPESMMLATERSINIEQTYSGVVVRVEHPERDPIESQLWDLDPRSPTYSLGPFGRRPYGYSSPVITTQAQADQVAATILPRVTKMRQEAVVHTIGHPGHEIGDMVTVVDPRTRTEGNWVIRGGTVHLRPSGGSTSWKLQEVPA
jgi:hypothetical protein